MRIDYNGMVQNHFEIDTLFKFLEPEKIRLAVEVGVELGGTTLALAQLVAPENGKVFAIDFFDVDKAIVYRGSSLSRLIVEIKGNSHDENTLKTLVQELGNDRIDFLFLDANHTYEDVKKDYEIYAPLVRKGGFLALHDIRNYKGDVKGEDGVWRLWEELKKDHNWLEVSAEPDHKWMGIGLIQK